MLSRKNKVSKWIAAVAGLTITAGLVEYYSPSQTKAEAPAAVTPTHEPAVKPLDATHLRAGLEAESAGDLELARLHLAQAVVQTPLQTEGLEALCQVCISLSQRDISEDNHAKAWDSIADARNFLNLVHKALSSTPEGSVAGFPVIVKLDRKLQEVETSITADVQGKGAERIRQADQCAVDAHLSWYTFSQNDRYKVVVGLRHLQWIQARYELADTHLQAEFFRAQQRLKDVVSDKEWDSLRASAGFTKRAK